MSAVGQRLTRVHSPDIPNMIYIVAEQHKQAVDFGRRLGLYSHSWAYVADERRLYGVRSGSLVIFTDTAARHPCYAEILGECSARQLQTVVVDADRLP